MLRVFAACGIPEARLSLVGSGPLERECRTLAGALGVQDRVTWHGVVPDAWRYLKAFDVVTLTSWTEGTPMILLEAMAAEVPVVATRVGGIPEVVSASEAMLVQPGEVQSIADAVASVLTERTGATARAREARRRLALDFSVDSWVRRYRAIYDSAAR
jgi:glycosyltransferase involved in cell wall biosynthesis